MKIGILIDRLNVGGVEKIAIEQVNALRSIGVDASLVVLSRKAVVENAFADSRENTSIVYLDDRLPGFLKLSFKFPMFSFFSLFHVTYPFFIPFVIKRKEFDYFIVHSTYTAFTAIMIKKFRKISFSVFIWDPIVYIINRAYSPSFNKIILDILRFIATRLDSWIVNNTDSILVGGSAHNRFFQELNNNISIHTIYPAVYSEGNVAKVKKGSYILLVTAWKRGKNPEYLLELFKRNKKLSFKLVGKWIDPLYKEEFEAKIQKSKAEGRIQIIGEVTDKELSNYYKEALFLLQINDDRGFGMPALESAGHGTTFIIPEGQGVCELFEHGKDGFFTKEKDTKTILEYVSILIKNKSKARDMGLHAWNTVNSKYSWEKHAEQLKIIYKKYDKN